MASLVASDCIKGRNSVALYAKEVAMLITSSMVCLQMGYEWQNIAFDVGAEGGKDCATVNNVRMSRIIILWMQSWASTVSGMLRREVMEVLADWMGVPTLETPVNDIC
jgi:hypothetical protein